jgi:cell division protein FtsB
MTPTELIELLKYAEKIENPIAITVGVIIIVFLLWRKFWHSEYLTVGKQNYDELKVLYDTLKTELQDLRKKYEELEIKNKELQEHIKNTCAINTTD